MGEGGFNAGSLFVEMGVQLDKFNAGFAQAKATLSEFGAMAVTVQKQLDTGGGAAMQAFTRIDVGAKKAAEQVRGFSSGLSEIGATSTRARSAIDDIDSRTVRLGERFLRASVGMLAAQVAIESFGGHGKKAISELGQATEIGATALTRFIFTVGALPGPLGVGLGALAAMATVYKELTAAVELAAEQMARVDANTLKAMNRVATAVGRADVKALLGGPAGDVQKKINVLNDSLETQAGLLAKSKTLWDQENLTLTETAAKQARLSEEIKALADRKAKGEEIFSNTVSGEVEVVVTLDQRIAELVAQKEGWDLIEKNTRVAIQETTGEIKAQERAIKDLLPEILSLGRASELLGKREGMLSALKNVTDSADLQKQLKDLGVSQPFQGSNAALGVQQRALQTTLEWNQAVRKAADEAGSDEELRNRILQTLVPDGYVTKLANETIEAFNKVQGEKALDKLAHDFSSALGSSLEDALMNAKRPMEALADFGRSLFSNMVQDLEKKLGDGLSSVLNSLGGGTGLATALTAALGVGGAVLSRLGSSSTSTFGSIQSSITSREQTRGIISGPSSIAIAAVGENLQRAMVPVTTRLDVLITLNVSMESSLRAIRGARAGSGGGGGQFPGVASDLA
jgi:hypothetical protein